jgi:uncharacterized HhH-GPD family protein
MREAFATPPAIHRFPSAMADRVRALAAIIATDYEGDAANIWRDATSAKEITQRLSKLPGIGPMKSRTILALLANQFGVRPQGWEDAVPDFPTLGEVSTPEELAEYQAGKRAWKAQLRAQGVDPAKHTQPPRAKARAKAKAR